MRHNAKAVREAKWSKMADFEGELLKVKLLEKEVK